MNDRGELTTKALQLLKVYLECGCNKVTTARRLGKSYTQVYSQLHKPYVRNIFKMLLLERGITFDKLAKVMDEGLGATKITGYLNNKVDGVEKVSDEFIETPDYATRHKYLNTALEAFEILKYNVKVDATVINNNIILTQAEQEEYNTLRNRVKDSKAQLSIVKYSKGEATEGGGEPNPTGV